MKKRIGILLMLLLICITVTALAGVQITDEETFPDENFRRFLQTLDEDGDGWIIPWGLTEMECSGWEIHSLSGICNFFDLEKLNCSSNKLDTVVTENLSKLQSLNCSGNPMSALDITKNTTLKTLNISKTGIQSLEIAKGSALAKAAAAEPTAYGSGASLWRDDSSGSWIIANSGTTFKEVGEEQGEDPDLYLSAGAEKLKAGNLKYNKSVGTLYAVSSDPDVLLAGNVTEVIRLEPPMSDIRINFIASMKGVSPGTATLSVYDTLNPTHCHWSIVVHVMDPPPAPSYQVTVTTSGNGTAFADPASGPEGTLVNLVADPDEGYRFAEWQIISGDVEIVDSKFTIGTSDVTLNAVFKKLTDLSKAKVTVQNQVYTGKALKPAVTVKLGKKVLDPDTDYTVSYSNNKKIGKAAVTVTGIGAYTGEANGSFSILPKQITLSSLKAGTKQLTVKWKKGTAIDGYEIQYALKDSFKGKKTVILAKPKATGTILKNLKAKTTYYVRIRSYKKVDGKTYYSEWSKVLSKKTK